MQSRCKPERPLHKILCVGREEIVQYYWGEIPDEVPSHWTARLQDPEAKYPDQNWQRYYGNFRPDHEKRLEIESVSLYDDTIFIDPWLDSYKWSGARTMYHGSIVAIRDRLDAIGLIAPRTKFVLGNWASGEVYSALEENLANVRQWSLDEPLRLWHGTTQGRAREIQLHGFEPLQSNRGRYYDDGVYFSGERFRAGYFARNIGKIAGSRDKEKSMGPDYKVPVVIELVIPPQEFHRLRADDDWMMSELHRRFEVEHGGIYSSDDDSWCAKQWGIYQRQHKKNVFQELAPRWQDSLREFGQVAILGALDAKHVVVVEGRRQPRL